MKEALDLEIKQEVVSNVALAESVVIDTPEQYVKAGQFFTALNGLEKKIKGWFAPKKAVLYDAWKEMCAEENLEVKPVVEAKGIISKKLAEYKSAQDKLLESQVGQMSVQMSGQKTATLEKVSYRTYWQAEVLDKTALIVAVVANKGFERFLSPDISALKEFASSTDGAMAIPGVKFWSEQKAVAR